MALPELRPPGEVPAGPLQWLREWIVQAVLWKQMRDPSNPTVGDPLDKFITRREAVSTGVFVPKPGGGFAGGSGGGSGGPIIITPPAEPYVPDLTPPPTAEGLTVTAGFTQLIIRWDPPTYTQGRGHAQTLIYGAVWLEGEDPPVFADAQLIDSAVRTNIHSFPTNPSTRWAIWIKWQSIDGGISTTPAGGANGVVAKTGADIDSVLEALSAAALNPAAPYGVFTLRGGLINVADDEGNATDLFFILTEPTVINGQTVEPGMYLRNVWVHDGYITNAMLGRAIIDDAVINTISAAKFLGGEMRVDSYIQSTNFTPGPEGLGFRWNSDGSAELQAAYIRGRLTAAQIDTTGLSIRNTAGDIILNAGDTPTIGAGVRISGGTLTLGDLAAGSTPPPIVTLTATGQIFTTPGNGGAATPTSLTLTAAVQNIPSPTYVWRVDGVVQAGATTSSFTIASFAPGPSKLVRVDVTGTGDVTGSDVMSVYSLREGSDAYSAGLDGEFVTVACDYLGNPLAGQLPITSRLIVARGSTLPITGVTYSIDTVVGFTTPAIDADGYISIAGISANKATLIARAVVDGGGPTLERTFTAVKSRAGPPGANGTNGTNGTNGLNGDPGPRGSLSGYGYGQYGIVNSVYAGVKANRVILNMLTGASLTTDLADTSHLRIGDTVTLGNGTNFSETRFWTGTSWQLPGVVISGNLLVGGDISGGLNINITGYARIEGGLGLAVVNPLTGSSALTRTAAGTFNTTLAQDYGVVAYSSQSSGGGAALYGFNGNIVSGMAVAGRGVYAIYGVTIGTGGAALTGDATAGGWGLRVIGASSVSGQIVSTVATGVAPFSVSSTTVVTNLNAGLLGGQSLAQVRAGASITGTVPSAAFATEAGRAGGFTMFASAGSSTVIFPGNNKPGPSSGLFNDWFVIATPGGAYCVPAWAF